MKLQHRGRPETWRARLAFWLIWSVTYVAGTYGLGWLVGHPFHLVEWLLGTMCILAGWFAASRIWRLIERRITRGRQGEADARE